MEVRGVRDFAQDHTSRGRAGSQPRSSRARRSAPCTPHHCPRGPEDSADNRAVRHPAPPEGRQAQPAPSDVTRGQVLSPALPPWGLPSWGSLLIASAFLPLWSVGQEEKRAPIVTGVHPGPLRGFGLLRGRVGGGCLDVPPPCSLALPFQHRALPAAPGNKQGPSQGEPLTRTDPSPNATSLLSSHELPGQPSTGV